MKINLLLVVILFSISVQAQTKEDRAKISNTYNKTQIVKLQKKFKVKEEKRQKEVADYVKKHKIPLKGFDGKNAYMLDHITPDGKPIYIQTYNYNAAKTIRTHKLYNNGGMGLNIQGQNMIVGLWDGGPVRLTHQLISGRVEQKDNINFTSADDYNRHALHVTGTMIGGGAGPTLARGMAFQAHEWAHDWNNDDYEMITRASEGLLASNHSYGMRAFSAWGSRLIDLYWFGKYDQDSHNWDEMMYNAPYYLIVNAAGNDRQHASQGPNKGGYDMLTGHSNLKNGITVAAVNRVSNYTGPSSVNMSSFSNWGPTDDGRIKPDISAQGVDLYSSVSDTNTSYDTYSGTSMASPTVTGSAILLQQVYKESYGGFMKSATLRGLILHTADEAGNTPGPDYKFGWGLMNTQKAAQTILDNGLKSIIRETTLNQGETYTFTVEADGSVPIMASICWTDPAGAVITGTSTDMLDNATPMLVNDLDIRVSKNSTTYMPWILNPSDYSAAATHGDNILDNIEKVEVENPTGTYTITITHKGNLSGGKQNVSIIVTGITNPFAINTKDGDNISVCADNEPTKVFHLHYSANSGTTGSTSFSVNGLPAGVNASFSPTSLSSDSDFDMTLSGLNNAAAGNYSLEIIGQNNGVTRSKIINLHILRNTFDSQLLVSPANEQANIRIPVTLTWAPNPNAETYLVQVAYNSSFSNIFVEREVTSTSITLSDAMSNGTTYYWRVKPKNRCWEGNYSQTWQFDTMVINCGQGYNLNPVDIPSSINNSPITSTLNYANSDNISYLKVYLDITHSQISDLEIKVTSPNGSEAILMQSGTCSGNYQNIQANFFDNADDFIECNSSSPAIRDDVKPYQALSAFTNENAQGNWVLSVYDPVSGNGGTINLWAIEVCTEILDVPNQSFDLFKAWPNPSNGQLNIQLSAEQFVQVSLIDLSGRIVYQRNFTNNGNTFTTQLVLGNLKKGVYLLKVNSNHKQGVKRIIIQ